MRGGGLMLEIGKIYRYASSATVDGVIPEIVDSWITGKSGDRGIDFVARMDISSQISALKIVILGQAKCEKLDKPTGGVHIARTVARLKRGWFGVYVTTSYFSDNVQLEVLDDISRRITRDSSKEMRMN